MSSTDYIYDNESSIQPQLKCPICSRPFVDPVIAPNGARNCRLCIIRQHQLHNSHPENEDTSSLTDELHPVEEPLLLAMLDSLPVTCPLCRQSKIHRGHLSAHLENDCHKREVPCLAADLRCPWRGTFDQRHTHVEECVFEALRPVLQATLGHQLNFRDYQTIIEEQQTRTRAMEAAMEEIKASMGQVTNRLGTLEKGFRTIFDLARKHSAEHQTLQQEVNRVKLSSGEERTRTDDEFRRIYEQVDRLSQFQSAMQDELQRVNELAQAIEPQENNNDLIPPVTEPCIAQDDIQLIRLHEEKIHELQERQRSQQQQTMQITEMIDRHAVQIGFLAQKKSLAPEGEVSRDFDIRDALRRNGYSLELHIEGRPLSDVDVHHIFHNSLRKVRCGKVFLSRNNLTNASVNSIAEALQDNRTITELCLVRNIITDNGVHALARTLATTNSTVEWLDLNSNGITDVGVEYLADMLKANRSISTLMLNSNQLTNRSVRCLAEVLSRLNDKIQQLSLATNVAIDDDCIDDILTLLDQNRTLRYFFVNECGFSEDGKEKLRRFALTRNDLYLGF